MTKLVRMAALAAAAFAAAAPGLALAQTTGTRLPATTVEPLYIQGAIDDGSQAQRGEDPADAAIAELPAVYEDDAAAQPQPAPAKGK